MREATPVKLLVGHPSEYRSSSSAGLFGPLCISIGTECFPGREWTDFVLILGWWEPTLRAMLRGRRRRTVLSFMDGSFALRIERAGVDSYVLTTVESDCDGGRKTTDGHTLGDFLKQIHEAKRLISSSSESTK